MSSATSDDATATNNQYRSSRLVLAAIAGFLYHYVALILWGFLPIINPIADALYRCCVTEPWFQIAMMAQDLVLNLLLQLPLALFLLRMSRGDIWGLVIAALLPSLLFWNYHLVYPNFADELLTLFLPRLLFEYLILPMAVVLLMLFFKLRQ